MQTTWDRMGRIRLFPLLFQNGCSQSSRFLPQAKRIVGSGDENAICDWTKKKSRDLSLGKYWRVAARIEQSWKFKNDLWLNSLKLRAFDCPNCSLRRVKWMIRKRWENLNKKRELLSNKNVNNYEFVFKRMLYCPARVKNVVRMRVFPASGAYLPLKLYAITKQTRFQPRN